MVGGGRDIKKASNQLGLPTALLEESETFCTLDGGIFPDNVPIVQVFKDMSTQWRTGPSGPTGLDYSALPVVFSIRRIKAAEREDVFDFLRVMEVKALSAMRYKQ